MKALQELVVIHLSGKLRTGSCDLEFISFYVYSSEMGYSYECMCVKSSESNEIVFCFYSSEVVDDCERLYVKTSESADTVFCSKCNFCMWCSSSTVCTEAPFIHFAAPVLRSHL